MGEQYTRSDEQIDDWADIPVQYVDDWDDSRASPGRAGRFIDRNDGPYAVLVKLEPNTILEEHFHTENQWQVILEGSCEMYGEKLTPFAVHYTEANTAYGPIAAGDEGLTFMTLREEHPTGYHPVDR